MTTITIRPLTHGGDMAALEHIQRTVWGDAADELIQAQMLMAIAHNGGLVLGAFDDETLVGGAVAFLGTASNDETRPAMANLQMHSRWAVVLEPYRNQGIGTRLKAAEYEFCSRRGIRLMTWVFDPLHGESANISLRKVGAVVSRYYPSFYGAEGDAVPPGSGGHFQADWWLTGSRARERMKGGRRPLTLEQYLDGGVRILNPTTLGQHMLPEPSSEFVEPESVLGLIEVPSYYRRIEQGEPALARAWREHSQMVFSLVLDNGFLLTDFLNEPYQGRVRSFYVCSLESSLRQIDRSFNQN